MSKKSTRKKKITLRRLKNWFLGIIGLAVIFLAISFTLIRVAIKYVPDYSLAIQQAVSEELNIKLEVEQIDAEIYWLVPRLNLYKVKVYDETGKKLLLHANEIDLSLDWANTVRTMLPAISEITLDGIELQIGVNKKNQVLVQDYIVHDNVDTAMQEANQAANQAVSGLSAKITQDILSEELQFVINNLDFKILNSQVKYYDERNPKHSKTLNKFNLRLINGGDEHKFEVQASLPGSYGNHLHVVLDIDGDLFDYKNLFGELYVSVDDIRLAPWFDDYWNSSGFAVNANVYAQGWLSWKELEVTDIQGHFNLMNASIHYLGDRVNTWKLNQLDGRVQWEKQQDGWQLDVRDLKSVRKGVAWPTSTAATLKMSDKNQKVQLQTNFLRIEGLAYLAGMANSIIDEEVPWLDMLDKHQPSGDLHNLDVSFPIELPEDIKINTEFSNISFSLPGVEPAAVNNLQGSISYLDKKTWLVLDSKNAQLKFNKLFRNSMDLTRLRGALEISYRDDRFSVLTNSLHIDTPHISTENRFGFSLHEGKPFLDLITKYRNGNAKYTGLYLPAENLGKDTTDWLDRAIVSGHVTDGGYIIYGKLTDFPFRQSEGVSLADFNVSNARLEYLKDWPVINEISANVRIENESLLLKANKGKIFDSNITQAKVYIDSFKSPNLDITGHIDTPLSGITRYIKQSPLWGGSSDYINNVELSGEGGLDLDLFVPLMGNSHIEWGGVLSTQNGGVTLSKENYHLSDINASVRFADAFYEASSVKANFEGKPVNIDLVTRSNSDAILYRFDITGKLSAQSLLLPVPEVKEYFSGETDWNVGIDISKAKFDKNNSLNINVTSDLLGVSSDLPGPFSKKISDRMPLVLNLQKKTGSYITYDLSLNDNKKIKIQEFKDHWTLSADVPSVKGTVDFSKAIDIVSPIKVNLEHFDINEFLKYGKGESAIVNSEVLAGRVSPDNISPRDIPAIDFKAKRLSWKKFKFNMVEASTRQTKLGLVVDKFKLVAKDYAVMGKGNWYSGWNKQHTSSFEFDMDIKNLGRAFEEIDLTSDLKDTQGNAHMRLKWADKPHHFSWSKLQGDGRLNLNDGTINQVEVGAGRVLGLFNLQTILSLDFANQVSKGFTFDKVNGSFSLSNGNAYTDDIIVESKVADIFINGELGIEHGTVDQKVRVRPHVESTVALGTAVIAGPTVGGLVYLFQKIFTPDRLSDYEYSIKGKIDNPVIELISVPADNIDDEEDDDSDY